MPVEEFWAGFRPRWRRPAGNSNTYACQLEFDRPLGETLNRFTDRQGLAKTFGNNFEGKIAQGGQFSYLDESGEVRAGAFSSIRIPKTIELATEQFGLISVRFKDLGERSQAELKFSKIVEDETAWRADIQKFVERLIA